MPAVLNSKISIIFKYVSFLFMPHSGGMEAYMDKEKDLSPVNAVNDSRSTMEKVEDWLTNTFWFHYKWYYIVGVFVLSLLIMAAVSI